MRAAPGIPLDLMKEKIDSDQGRQMITPRFATVEPVFGNLRGNKWLYGQWRLYCVMHNAEKLAHHGYANGME
jgi:hypothetical protein